MWSIYPAIGGKSTKPADPRAAAGSPAALPSRSSLSPPYPSATVLARLAVLAALLVAASGCGGDDDPTEAAQTPTPNPTTEAEAPAQTPAPPSSGANAYIGSIAVDPKDGT